MNLAQQKEVISLYKLYQAIDRNTIKANLKIYTEKAGLKPLDIAKYTGIPVQTIYQMRKLSSVYKPDFITCLVICDLLQISIMDIIQPLTGSLILPKIKPAKWSVSNKSKFVKDYNSLDITSICKKYSITPRTAQEYQKNFIRDLEDCQ